MVVALKLYADAHIPKAVCEQLRARGVDIVRCQDLGFADESDAFHLEYATGAGHTVISGDVDFLRLHTEWQRSGRRHCGIFFVHPQLLRQGMNAVGTLVRVLQFYEEAVSAGAASLEQEIWNRVIYITSE